MCIFPFVFRDHRHSPCSHKTFSFWYNNFTSFLFYCLYSTGATLFQINFVKKHVSLYCMLLALANVCLACSTFSSIQNPQTQIVESLTACGMVNQCFSYYTPISWRKSNIMEAPRFLLRCNLTFSYLSHFG